MKEISETEITQKHSVSIKDLFFKYVRFLPLFILTVGLALTGAFIYLRYTNPIYDASGSLLLRNDKAAPSSNEKFEQIFQSDGQKNIQSEIEFIRSRPLMYRVVKELGLNFSYYSIGKVRENNIYKSCPFYIEVLELKDTLTPLTFNLKFPDSYSFRVNNGKDLISIGQVFRHGNGMFRLVKDVGVINSEYKVTWTPTHRVAGQTLNNLIVSPKGQGSNIITLLCRATNPVLAADIVNELMEVYQEAIIEEKKLSTQRTLEFIDERLKIVEKEVDSATARIVHYKRVNNLIDQEAQSTNYFSQLSDIDKQINTNRSQLEIAGMLENYLRNSQNSFSLVPSSLGLADPTLNTLISAYNVTQLRFKELIDGNTPRGNVIVQQQEEQIESLRRSILENLRNIKQAMSGQIADLQRKNAASESQLRSLPAKRQTLIDLERQMGTKLGVYNILLQKREESAISRAGTISNIKVLEPANPNENPVQPNRRNIYLIALGIGLLLPTLLIVVLELLNDKVRTRADIERVTTVPILGEVGHSFSNENLVVRANSRGIVAEQFRIIRSNLQYVVNQVERPVILVTSSFSGEGKSFISTNMGAVMALAGKKTVVLEFDIRKPKILKHLNLPNSGGLTNYLLGKASPEELLVTVPDQENLYVMPCGPIPPNPSELLLDPKLDDLFVYLKSNFEVIIMDTAPVGMVSDAQTLSKYADATLYIVRQGHTYKKQVHLIDEFYHGGKLPRISLIVNDVKISTGYGYYGYGRYGYGQYGYGGGYGYFEEDKQKKPGLMYRWFGLGSKNGKSGRKKKKHRVS